MMYLLLAALGLSMASVAFDWGDSNSDEASDGGNPDEPDPDPDDTATGEPGIIDIATGDVVLTGTDGDDQLGAQDGATIQGAAGDDYLYVTSGTAEGGSGDDTLEALYSLDQQSADGQVILQGGAGNDFLSLDTDGDRDDVPHIADGGDGDDTVSVYSASLSGIEITLGEGADALQAQQDSSNGNGFSDDVRVTDFDVTEDRVEFVTDSYPDTTTITGVEVSAEAVEDEDAARVNFQVGYEFVNLNGDTVSRIDTHEMIFEGFDPADAGDIVVDILPAPDASGAGDEVVMPERDGTDLVFDIAADGFVLPGFSADFGQITRVDDSAERPGEDENPLADIEQVVFNISDDVDVDVYTEVVTRFSSLDEAGTETSTQYYLNIIAGPEGYDETGLVADQNQFDDSTYLNQSVVDPATGLLANRSYLAPFALVGQIYLGQVSTSDYDEDDNYDTRNIVDVVINRV